jgi:hypothetical protein
VKITEDDEFDTTLDMGRKDTVEKLGMILEFCEEPVVAELVSLLDCDKVIVGTELGPLLDAEVGDKVDDMLDPTLEVDVKN